ncbi:hypothetical protein B0H13DRAFT_2406718 [Mycena leptocephala]|nr:hypothetical protein B0H13DRAFT_2406718 [Mycena leptocephala]
MSTKFPQELIDEILDYFAEDFRSLKFCSLVCREWVFRSRSHVFKKCSLPPSKIPGFCELLQSPACTLLPHVRTIFHTIHYDLEDYHCFNAVAADLGRLTNVRELNLTLMGIYRSPQPFVNMICLFPALQELEIYRSGAWEEIPTDTVPPPQLRSLVLCENSAAPILAWLDAVDHLPNVHSLTLPPLSLSDLSTVRAALRRLGTALHHLVIKLNERESNGGARYLHRGRPVAPPQPQNVVIHDSWADYEAIQMIPSITKLAAPALERLSLELNLSQAVYMSLDWASLDAFLSPARFPRLRNVTVKCCVHGDHFYQYYVDEELEIEDEHEFLRGAFPLLEASGVLRTEW